MNPPGNPSLWNWTADETAASARADVTILRALEEGHGAWQGEPLACSRSRLQKLIEAGQVLADGTAIRGRDRLTSGMRVEVRFPAPRPARLVPEDRPLDVLYEDAHLIVVNKPPGLTVHPSETQADGTLVHALLHHVHDLSGIGGELRPGIVHRIDKDTSGALVITKTDAAHRKLAEVFAAHEIERAYWAVCYGAPGESAGRIESLLGRNPQDRKRMSMEVTEGRRAVTHWRRLTHFALPRTNAFASLIEARLETGRTHQVRVHLTGLGHSLLGDPVYGTPSERHTKWLAMPLDIRRLVTALPGQALHARVLGFAHPITGAPLRFEAPTPPALTALLEGLKAYA